MYASRDSKEVIVSANNLSGRKIPNIDIAMLPNLQKYESKNRNKKRLKKKKINKLNLSSLCIFPFIFPFIIFII
jgi:hypothetical protein